MHFKESIFRICWSSRVLLFVNFCTLCFLCGFELEPFQKQNSGLGEYILAILTNHYYVLYCMLPVLFIIIAKYIKTIQDMEAVRFQNAFCQIRVLALRFSGWLCVYLLCHVLLPCAIGGKYLKIHGLTEQIAVNPHAGGSAPP